MAELKTKANDASVGDFIDRVEDTVKRQDSIELLDMFGKITGEKPKMWGPSIIGFGQYHYKSEKSRQEGDWPLTGFSPRKQSFSLYLTTAGYVKYTSLLGKLGKHKIGKGCLYINKLSDIDRSVLGELIRETYVDSKQLF
jgi:Domain of unknown function (DU1801)